MAEIGHVTDDLIAPEKLNSILREIGSPLDPNYVYRYFPVHLLALTEFTFAYVFKIPKLTSEKYLAWNIATVPFLLDGQLMQLKPELFRVAVQHESGAMFDSTYCTYEKPMLCPNAIVYRNMPCVQGILARNADLIPTCPVVAVNMTLPVLEKVADHQLLLSTPHDVLVERCLGHPPVASKVPTGTHLLSIFPNCTITSDKYQWSYSMGSRAVSQLNVNDRFFLEGMTLKFSVPPPVTVPTLDWSHLGALSNLTRSRLPSLSSLMTVPYLSEGAHAFFWVPTVVACLLVVGLGGFLLYRYRQSLLGCCPRVRKPVRLVRPTLNGEPSTVLPATSASAPDATQPEDDALDTASSTLNPAGTDGTATIHLRRGTDLYPTCVWQRP
jgi:hypothetical protein